MNCHCQLSDAGHCVEKVPIFNSLSGEELEEIAAITTAKSYDKGEMIYLAGDPGDKLFVIHSGQAKIARLSPTGREQVIRILEPGQFMGELSLFNSVPRADYAGAVKASTLCMIEGDKLKELMAAYPSIAFKIMEELSRRLQRAEQLIENINLHSVEQRLAQVLLHMSEGKREVLLNMSKGDFASQLGMSQETLSRKLSSFQEEQLIKLIGHRKIIILDPERLAEFMADPSSN